MKAITHAGQAHADDVLSAAYLIANTNFYNITEIERRDPTAVEIMDDEVIVFDVGGQHSPEANNFDHHHFPRNADPFCALSLVLAAHDDYDDWNAIFPWLKGTEIMDSKGPFFVSEQLGVKFEFLAPYVFCPFAGFILSMFESQDVHKQGERCFELLRQLGESLNTKVQVIRERWQHFDHTTDMIIINGLEVAVFQTTGPLGIESWLQANMPYVKCVISNDDRGDGLSLFRRNDHPGIDFSKCEGMPNVTFAHKNGFVAKINDDQWEAVFNQATK